MCFFSLLFVFTRNFVDACLKESNLPARTTPLPQPKPPVQPQRPPAQSSALGSATQPAAAAVRGKEIIMARYIYFDDDDESAEEFYVSQQQQQKVSQHEPAAAVSESAQPSTTPAAPVASTFSPTVAQHSAAAPAVVAVSAASHAASSAPAAAPSATASGNGGKSMLRFIYSDEDDDAEASATPAQSAAPAPAVQSAAPAPVVKSVAPVSHAVSTALAPASAAPVASAVHAPTPVAAAATVSRTPTRAAEPAASSAPVSVPGSSGSKSLCRFIYADEEDEEAGPAAAAPSTAESTEDPSSKPSVQIPTEASPAKHVHWPAQVDADQIEIAARDEQQDASSEGGPVLSVFHPTETSVTAVLEELSPASPSPRPVFAEETAQLEETEIFSVCPQEGEGHAAQVASKEAVAVEEEAEVVQPVQLASAFADVEEQPQQQEDLQDASEFVDEPVLLQETVIAEQAVDKEGALEAIDDLVVLTESVSLAVTEAAVEIAAAEPEQEPASEAAAEEAPALEPVEEPVPAHSAAAVDEAPKQQPVKQDPVPASAPSAFSLAPPAPADTSSKASKKKRKNKKKKKGGSTPVEDDVNCDDEAETPQLEDGETGNSPVPESSSAGEPQSAPQEPAAASDAVAAEPAIAAEAPFVDPTPQEVEKEKVVIGATEEEERVVIGATEEEERAGEATSLDGTLNNSADFADALDGLPASVLASKTGAAAAGAQKMVWKAHPEAVDQQPVPMVWHLHASADTTAESVAMEKETSAVAGAESKPDSSNGHSSIAKEPVHTTPDTKKVPAVSAKVEAAKPSTANQQQQSASPAPSKRPTDPAAAARALAAMNAFTDSVKPKAATAPTPPLAHQQARSIPASSPHGVASLASHSNGSANSNTAKAPTWNFAPPAGDTWDFTPSTSSAQPQKASTDASFAPTSPSVWSSPSATLQPACTTPSSGGMPQMTRGYSSNTTSPMQWAGTPPMRPLSSGQIRTGAAGLPGAVASPAAPIVQANKKYLDMSDPFAGL